MIYRPEIDGLRAIAVLPVILFHAGWSIFGGGFVGVDVFFVISGYLITSVMLSEISANNFSIGRFYERRARRILPALFLVLFCSVVAAWVWLPPRDMVAFCKSLIAVSFFGSNFLFWSESGYFDLAADLKPLLHTWSLAVEEQFYLLFPLVLAFCSRRRAWWVVVTIASLGMLSLAAAQFEVGRHPMAAFFLLPTRGWELLLGSGVALYRIKRPQRLKNTTLRACVYEIWSLVGFGLIIASVFVFDKTTPSPSVYTLAPTVGTALVLLFCDGSTLIGRMLSLKWVVGVGLISYSAYLWHHPLFAFTRRASVAVPDIKVFSVLTVVAFCLAYLSWRLVERPFRARDRVSRRTIIAFSVVGIVCFSSFGVVGVRTQGFIDMRLTPDMQRIIRGATFSPRRNECLYEPNTTRPKIPCVYNKGGMTWAVIGDSHVSEIAWVLAQSLQERGESLQQFSSQEKPTFSTSCAGNAACKTWTESAIDQIVTNPEIRNVVVVYRIHWYLSGDHLPRYPIIPNNVSGAEQQRRWSNYVEVLRRLAHGGKNVILVLQVPEVRRPMQDLVFQNPFDLDNIVGVSREWWQRRTSYVNNRLKDLPESIKILEPADIFCDEINCFVVKDGALLYIDDNHLSLTGAAKVVPRILELGEPPTSK
ncbi:MAG: hypothetical protein RIS36_994 [Pseudomonadota bacterium]|jgi:peptidoglycan/LPS O-acetylase OafA/YrhL